MKSSKEKLNLVVVLCSSCGEIIPEHEKYQEMAQIDIDEIECMDCEMKARDSYDIDNCF